MVIAKHQSNTNNGNLEKFVNTAAEIYSKENLDLIKKACELAKKAHHGQLRKNGDPYITHPISVASLLSELHFDTSTIIAAILHDTVEDTGISIKEIEDLFGKTVRSVVDGVTKISKMDFENTHVAQSENIRKMIIAMGHDIRVIIVKIADRLHNMRTLEYMSYEKQLNISQETLDIYAPIANRLGMSSWKMELEDLSFKYLKPQAYYDLSAKDNQKKEEYDKYIDKVVSVLYEKIVQNTNLTPRIYGRTKHIYSIYRKMRVKNIEYEDVLDIFGFRIITDTTSNCYEILGLIHSLYRPIQGGFKDYIAMPKVNNYQSLHTAVVMPGGRKIEIQIRTKQMHAVAENGIAAHWSYKEGNKIDTKTKEKFEWLKSLTSWHKDIDDSSEFLESVKLDLLDEDIYVFTPRGDVKELRDGATALDFAYSIHTDIGNKASGAKVDGKIVPLKHKLQNGDTVEILTSPNQTPSKDWLAFCTSSKAQSRIRAYVRAYDRKRSIELGRTLLEQECVKLEVKLNATLSTAKAKNVMESIGINNIDELYAQVGYGKHIPSKIITSMSGIRFDDLDDERSFLQKMFKIPKKPSSRSMVQVDGMSDFLVYYAKCCHPIPGDPIIGFISRERGVTIHRSICKKTFEFDRDRIIDVNWSVGSLDRPSRNTKVRVLCNDTSGVLKSISEAFTTNNINISNAQIRNIRNKKTICIFDVAVKGVNHINLTLKHISKIKNVIRAERI